MTQEEALRKLEELNIRFVEDSDGLIRTPCGRCPIVALAEAMQPESVYTNEEWENAASDIGLTSADGEDIVDAADDTCTATVRRNKIIETRKTLKALCAAKPQTPEQV